MNQTQNRNNYNFDQTSKSKGAGFISFKGSDGQYYFHFNDSEGVAFIFSEGYLSSDSRDKGIRTVIKNANEIIRYKFLKSDDSKFYFTINAANHQEIARSKNFETDRERNVMKTFFQDNLNLKSASENESEKNETVSNLEEVKNRVFAQNKTENIVNNKQNLVETFLKKSSVQTNDSNTMSPDFTEPLRQSFRIEIYPSYNGSPVNGKITYLLDNEVSSFSGIDYDLLNQFIESKINHYDPKKPKKNDPKDFEHHEVAELSLAHGQDTIVGNSIKHKTETFAEQSTVDILEAPMGHPTLGKKDRITIVLNPTYLDAGLLKKSQICRIKIFGYNFESRENSLLLNQKRELELKDGVIKLQIQSKDLKQGSYRLSAVASVDNESISKNLWIGSTFSLIS